MSNRDEKQAAREAEERAAREAEERAAREATEQAAREASHRADERQRAARAAAAPTVRHPLRYRYATRQEAVAAVEAVNCVCEDCTGTYRRQQTALPVETADGQPGGWWLLLACDSCGDEREPSQPDGKRTAKLYREGRGPWGFEREEGDRQ